jgi:hypothetical protein
MTVSQLKRRLAECQHLRGVYQLSLYIACEYHFNMCASEVEHLLRKLEKDAERKLYWQLSSAVKWGT